MDFLVEMLAWVLFGALAGWLTAKVMHLKTEFWGNVVLGVIGAIVGGGLVELLGGAGITGFNLPSLIVAVIGGCLFTWIVRRIDKRGEL